MEFFFVVKATQKSGKQDAVIWFTAKTESRALLQLDVELEDAGIETGRGKDYLKPHRTNFPVVDGLPEEAAVDYTWCERYELEEDGRTWQLKAGCAPVNEFHPVPGDSVVVDAADATLPATLETTVETTAPAEEATVPVEGRSLAVRLAIHMQSDKYLTHVTKEQQMAASELAAGESALETDNAYLKNLLQSISDVAGFTDLSLHVEWKLVQAVKSVFPQDDDSDPALLAEFITAWIAAEPECRSALTNEWESGYAPAPAEDNAQRSAAAMQERAITHTAIPFEKRVFGTWLFGLFDELTPEQSAEASSLELDMDANYAQNVMLACRNVAQLKHVFPETLADLFAAAKSVWPVDGKAPLLSNVMAFFKEWIDTHTTGKTSREDVTAKWQKKFGSNITRTDSGTNAGGGNKTDRNQDYAHTLDTLDVEIALATLPMDFDIYEIPGSIHRRAKEIVSKKESPFKEWSAALRSTPGILDFSRAAIFAVVRSATEKTPYFPGQLQAFINTYLNEIHHDKPTDTVLSAARQVDSAAVVAAVIQGTEPVESLDKLDTSFSTVGKLAAAAAVKPEVQNLGAGRFSIEGLMGSTTTTQEAAHEQMEATVQVEDKNDSALSPGEGADEAGQQTVTLTPAEVLAAAAPSLAAASAPEETAEPEEDTGPVYPEFFEPGRYEGLPNNVYHAANGISSTQVKDARVSLMFYHGRHVTKTIRRESSEALAFGSLAHTMALEPEKLEEEFAVFPGVPAEAFTNTDSLKAFIREYNADKPKAEQLKLTGKKEELQEAIRAVNPDAIFADEFEQQWRDSVAGKTILTNEQLNLATAIQQALLNHESAGKLLRHPSRAVETSYFGIDDETGLEVRVRPDLEVEINGVRIGVDLKTISMGRIKQDGLRARLHREIIDRDYHLSAGMYSSVADFDQFFWIFVNKDEGHHWVAVIEASRDLLDLGLMEYQKAMRALATAYDTDCWPAPITADYTDELNDFDLRRLEALRAQA